MEILNGIIFFVFDLVFHMIQSPIALLSYLCVNAAILIGLVVYVNLTSSS